MSIGNNLRLIRSRKNLSQQDVADFLCVDRKTYASWENTGNIKGSHISNLAKFFCVEIGEFFREKSTDIVINQHNTPDNSTHRIIIEVDQGNVNELIKVMAERLGKIL